jgi:hypothetical protein
LTQRDNFPSRLGLMVYFECRRYHHPVPSGIAMYVN